MLKLLKSTFRKLCLSACKKISFISNFFLRYCKDIANLLLWELWECLTIPIKIIALIYRKTSCIYALKGSTSLLTPFLRYCKEIENLLFWLLWACLAMIKILSTCRKLSRLSAGKKTTSSPMLFWRFAKSCKLLLLDTLGEPGYAHSK